MPWLPRSGLSGPMRSEKSDRDGVASLLFPVAILPGFMRIADLVALGLGGANLTGSLRSGLSEAIVNWDGHWYLGIAAGGYSYIPGTDSNVAFFPAFPLAMRIFGQVTGVSYAWAGLAISLSASVLLSPLIYGLTKDRYGRRIAKRAAVTLAVFPTAFFFALPYPDAAFVAAVLCAFYFASADRWGPAGLAAFIASGLKIFGVFVALAFVWIALERADWKLGAIRNRTPLKALAASVFGLGGLAAYCAYLWAKFGQPFAFYSAQMDGWPHSRTAVFEPVLRTARELFRPGSYIGGLRPDLYWAYLLDVVVILISFFVLIAAAKRFAGSWLVFWVGLQGIALLSGTTNSFARYQLAAFPLMTGIALLLRHRLVNAHLFFMSGAAQLVFAYLFGKGWWVG